MKKKIGFQFFFCIIDFFFDNFGWNNLRYCTSMGYSWSLWFVSYPWIVSRLYLLILLRGWFSGFLYFIAFSFLSVFRSYFGRFCSRVLAKCSSGSVYNKTCNIFFVLGSAQSQRVSDGGRVTQDCWIRPPSSAGRGAARCYHRNQRGNWVHEIEIGSESNDLIFASGLCRLFFC